MALGQNGGTGRGERQHRCKLLTDRIRDPGESKKSVSQRDF